MSEMPVQESIWRRLGRAVVVTAAASVAVPYTLAVLANTLYGWPPGPDRYRRALHPRKVFALNYSILQQLDNFRYTRLYFAWNKFYSTASESRLIKDIPYGKNTNNLDVYLPRTSSDDEGFYPVVVFIYGGSWGSGNKHMYGLLASQLADMLKAVVIVPNYSLYPSGYVDDMVQDVVDTLTWIHHSAHSYHADKERILLLGHSAGGHLVAMATLELVMKRLLTNPESLIGPHSMLDETQQSTFTESMQFQESYFNGKHKDISVNLEASSLNLDEAKEPKEKPQIKLEESVNPDLLHTEGGPDTASTTGSFYFVDSKSQSITGELPKDGEGEVGASQCQKDDTEDCEDGKDDSENEDPDAKEEVTEDKSETADSKDAEATEQNGEGQDEEEGSNGETPEHQLDLSELETSNVPDQNMTISQRQVRDILDSIKAVIGLAGVYHIADHYEHEAWRGVEDISSMGKAMYGPDFFDRFSPSHIVPNLPANTQFPPFHLVHGDADTTVPKASSTKFGQALWDLGCRQTQVTLLPGCGHKDICLDLMDPSRAWYDPVMTAILETARRYL